MRGKFKLKEPSRKQNSRRMRNPIQSLQWAKDLPVEIRSASNTSLEASLCAPLQK